MARKMKLFMKRKGLRYVLMLVGLCHPVIIAMVLLSFVDSLVFTTASQSYLESHDVQMFEIHEDFRLVGHIIETSITDEVNGGLRCRRNRKCQSYSCYSSGRHGNKTCELNDHSRHTKPQDLIPAKGFTYYEQIKQGWNSPWPGHSCKSIMDSGHSRGDGEYWIAPEGNGNPLSVYCDMTTEGGGWLLIYNIVINGSSAPTTLDIQTSYRGISHYNNSNMVLATTALNELRTHLSFTQLRFQCNKQISPRSFHVMTVPDSKGEAVVQYYSRQSDVQPDACGSFVRLNEDNSILAGDCARWGGEIGVWYVGKWGHTGWRELYDKSANIYPYQNWATNPFRPVPRWECDDYYNKAVTHGDFWKIYVR